VSVRLIDGRMYVSPCHDASLTQSTIEHSAPCFELLAQK
jgi:hypothetical protein